PTSSRLWRVDPQTRQATELYHGPPLSDVVAANDGTVVVLTAPVAASSGVTPQLAHVQVLGTDGSLTTIAGGGHRIEDTTTPSDFAADGCGGLGRGPGPSVLLICGPRVVQITAPSVLNPLAPVTGLTGQSQLAQDGSATISWTWAT